MTYFLSNVIPTLCVKVSVHYTSIVKTQGQEREDTQVGFHRRATRRNENTIRSKRIWSDIFTYDVITILCPWLCDVVQLHKQILIHWSSHCLQETTGPANEVCSSMSS